MSQTISTSQINKLDTITLAREGWAYTYGTTFKNVVTDAEMSITGTPTIPLGHAVVVNRIRIYTSGLLRIRVRVFDSATGAAPYELTGSLQYVDGNFDIEVPGWVITSGKSISILAAQGDGTTTYSISLSVFGSMIANDLDFNAPRRILWIGDSISKNTSVPYTVKQSELFQYIVRDNIVTTTGTKHQLVIKALSGKTGVDFDKILLEGNLDIYNPSIIFWQLGTNDVIQNTGIPAYTTAVNNIINYKKRVYPNSKLYILGSTPLENNTNETTLINYRTAAFNAVTAAADPLIKFINLVSSFDRTVSSNYASSDTPGDRIHPASVSAHLGIANTIISNL